MSQTFTDESFHRTTQAASRIFGKWVDVAEEELVCRLGVRDTAGTGRGQALQFVETSPTTTFEARWPAPDAYGTLSKLFNVPEHVLFSTLCAIVAFGCA